MRRETVDLHPRLRPMLDCPRFTRCSAPLCPLDPKLSQRDGRIDGSATGGVRERECRLPKAERMELGKGLPWRGLWLRELAARRRCERETMEARVEKARQMALGRKKVPIVNALGT